MAHPSPRTIAVALSATLLLAGCARHAWLLPPQAIVTRSSAARIVVRDDRGNDHDLGRGRWARTSSGAEVLSIPEVPYGELLCELSDGSQVRTVFDDRNYDPDLDGLPTGLDPTPFPVRPARDVDDDFDEDFDEDTDETFDESRESDDRWQRREEAWAEQRREAREEMRETMRQRWSND